MLIQQIQNEQDLNKKLQEQLALAKKQNTITMALQSELRKTKNELAKVQKQHINGQNLLAEQKIELSALKNARSRGIQMITNQKKNQSDLTAKFDQLKEQTRSKMQSLLAKEQKKQAVCNLMLMQSKSQLQEKNNAAATLNNRLQSVLKLKDDTYPRISADLVSEKVGGKGFQIWESMKKFKYDQEELECPSCDYRPVYRMKDGRLFLGQWSDMQQQGRGVRLGTNPEDGWKLVEEGYYKNGKLVGRGRSIWEQGHNYDGEYLNDKRNGFGTYTWANGEKYSGDWVNDRKEGRGVYSWPDGRQYDGQYNFDKRMGNGSFSWADGTAYVGQFKNGELDGQGAITWPDGRRYEGGFKNGYFQGKGKKTYLNGRIEEGLWENDKFKG